MTAKEARELTDKKLAGPLIEPLLEFIYQRIRHAIDNGKTSIVHPLYGLRLMQHPSEELQKALWKHLEDVDKYKVTHHPDPDRGDPRSAPYTEISW